MIVTVVEAPNGWVLVSDNGRGGGLGAHYHARLNDACYMAARRMVDRSERYTLMRGLISEYLRERDATPRPTR